MTKKNEKLTISLKKDDEAVLLALRSHLEKKHNRQYSLADVVRYCCSVVGVSNNIGL